MSDAPQPAHHAVDVLIVEDNAANRMVAEHVLKAMGLSHAYAPNGADALERYVEDRPRLVLMDIAMPRVDGLEAARRIREIEQALRRPRTPILAVTAHAFESDRERCLAAGMDGYLPKPVPLDTLRSEVARWLELDQADESAA